MGATIAIVILAAAVVLVTLQLKFFRDGDRRHREANERTGENQQTKPLPKELKNPAFRSIWRNMDETRELMERRQAEDDKEKKAREKSRLKLPNEEDILLIGERTRFYYWPVALVSLASLGASAGIPSHGTGITSFVLLAAGLLGLLFFSALKSRARYYLTNFRVLALKRPLVGGKPRWRALHYHQINRYVENKGRLFRGITIEGADESIEVLGLRPETLSELEAVLKEKTAAD